MSMHHTSRQLRGTVDVILAIWKSGPFYWPSLTYILTLKYQYCCWSEYLGHEMPHRDGSAGSDIGKSNKTCRPCLECGQKIMRQFSTGQGEYKNRRFSWREEGIAIPVAKTMSLLFSSAQKLQREVCEIEWTLDGQSSSEFVIIVKLLFWTVVLVVASMTWATW